MDIRIIKDKIILDELKKMAEATFIDMVKAVVDVNKKIMAVGGEWHADAEAVLLKADSQQQDLWGINIYPNKESFERIEFSSLINIRPGQNNRSMEILNEETRSTITEIINQLIQ